MGIKRKSIPQGDGTVIGKGTVVSGSIKSDAFFLRVDGVVDGDVITEGDLVVGSEGKITGEVKAASLNLAGTITGDVEIKGKTEIEAKGVLTGDIVTELLAMDATAILNGKVTMTGATEPEKTEATEAVAEAEKKADEKTNKKG